MNNENPDFLFSPEHKQCTKQGQGELRCEQHEGNASKKVYGAKMLFGDPIKTFAEWEELQKGSNCWGGC